MEKGKKIEETFSDFIFDNLDADSDGWRSIYEYKEVLKAMKWAYERGFKDALTPNDPSVAPPQI